LFGSLTRTVLLCRRLLSTAQLSIPGRRTNRGRRFESWARAILRLRARWRRRRYGGNLRERFHQIIMAAVAASI
jgi:hypothetical protein